MDLSDKGNEIIYFMDKSRRVSPLPEGVEALIELADGRRIKVELSRTIIGRGDADIRLSDPKISEEHAAIGFFDGIFFIIDLKSKNGTFVNGKKVIERVLKDGDEIKLGGHALTFYVSGRLHEEATARWQQSELSISKILEGIVDADKSGKFGEPTRIVIEGGKKKTVKAPLTQIFLRVLSGPDKGKNFNFLQKEIIVGRGRGDLSLNDPDVSKKHAEIVVYDLDEIFVRDLGSTNGTTVGDEKIDRRKLKSGDVITVGSTRMEVSFGEVLVRDIKVMDEKEEDTGTKPLTRGILSLEIVEGKDKGMRIELRKGKHFIGREKGEICLRDLDVSRKHARIEIDKDGPVLYDMLSTNGTFLNGKKIKREELKSGDEIKVGNTVIKVR